jgi:XTP/dITP diphosphohydrolase
MKTLIFMTTNKRKIQEANESLAKYDILVSPQPVDIDEIQHHDVVEISRAKARSAYDVIKKPLVIQDTTWAIPALNGFPGGYMKDIEGWFGTHDWVNLMAKYDDRSIVCTEYVVYFDGTIMKEFYSTYNGFFVKEPRGKDGRSVDKMVVLHGDKTMAEMHDEGKVGSSVEVLPHWDLFGEWYSKN